MGVPPISSPGQCLPFSVYPIPSFVARTISLHPNSFSPCSSHCEDRQGGFHQLRLCAFPCTRIRWGNHVVRHRDWRFNFQSGTCSRHSDCMQRSHRQTPDTRARRFLCRHREDGLVELVHALSACTNFGFRELTRGIVLHAEETSRNGHPNLLPEVGKYPLAGLLSDGPHADFSLAGSVLEFFYDRNEFGNPVETLEIQDCRIIGYTVPELSDVVHTKWDRKSLPRDEYIARYGYGLDDFDPGEMFRW